MRTFSAVLKSLRASRGMTQDDLAKALKISRSTISMYERGSREPDCGTLELIADYFNVDINYLLGWSDKTTYIPDSHCIDNEAEELAKFIHENPEYKVLFDASKRVKRENVDLAKQVMDKMA